MKRQGELLSFKLGERIFPEKWDVGRCESLCSPILALTPLSVPPPSQPCSSWLFLCVKVCPLAGLSTWKSKLGAYLVIAGCSSVSVALRTVPEEGVLPTPTQTPWVFDEGDSPIDVTSMSGNLLSIQRYFHDVKRLGGLACPNFYIKPLNLKYVSSSNILLCL